MWYTPAMENVVCPLCKEVMLSKKAHGDAFWECPGCRAEVWPADERLEKEVRKLMAVDAGRERGSGSRRKSRFKSRKPGEKFTPWYQRY